MKHRKPIISLQIPGKDNRYEDFHRVEADSTSSDDLHAALDRILTEPAATTRITPTGRATKWRRQPAKKPDEEVLPGVEVDRKIEDALAT